MNEEQTIPYLLFNDFNKSCPVIFKYGLSLIHWNIELFYYFFVLIYRQIFVASTFSR